MNKTQESKDQVKIRDHYNSNNNKWRITMNRNSKIIIRLKALQQELPVIVYKENQLFKMILSLHS